MLGKLSDALRAGGVPDDKAREAAEEVATYEKDLAEIKSDVKVLKWITGTTLAGVLALVLRPLPAEHVSSIRRVRLRRRELGKATNPAGLGFVRITAAPDLGFVVSWCHSGSFGFPDATGATDR